MKGFIKNLADPTHVVTFQRLCGVIQVHDGDESESVTVTSNNNCAGDDRHNTVTENGCDIKLRKYTTKGEEIRPVQQFVSEAKKPKFYIANRPLYLLFQLAAIMGNEVFYFGFYPFLWWNVDSVVARQTFLVWGIVMYIGEATKDVLQYPRPTSPPVVHLETQHLKEFALPSTHAMSATAIPITLFYIMYGRYSFPFWVGVATVVIWCSLVCLSRLYLGVHTFLDVLSGVLCSALLVTVTLPYLADFDWLQQSHPFSPVIVFASAVALVTVCYPSKDSLASKGDNVQIVSVVASAQIGSWINYQWGVTHIVEESFPLAIAVPTLTWIGLSVLRFLIGIICLFVVKTVMGKISIKFASYCLGLEKPDKKNPNVETFYKFFAYFCLGVLTSSLPVLHSWLGIGRPAYFGEVL